MTLPIPRLFVDSRPETAKQPDVVATKTRSRDTAAMRFVQHRDTQGPQSRMRENRRHGSEGRGTEFNQSVLTRSLTTVVWSMPLAASPTLPSSLCVISIVREPGEYQSACQQIRNSNDVSVPMPRQRLNRFRHMLITRNDDGDFGRNPDALIQ